MKISDLLVEGITFGPAIKKTQNGETYIDQMVFDEMIQEVCPGCDGTGKEDYNDVKYPCRYCDEKGSYETWRKKAGVPELQLSNSNGMDLLDWLGLEQDYVGYIEAEQIDHLYQTLMRIKHNNRSINQFTTPTTTDQSVYVNKSNPDIPEIKRGPTMINVGRNRDQIERYIDRLLELVKFCKINNVGIGWG